MAYTAILTRTGKLFDLKNPKPDLVDITDITYALARIPRFTGHARSFWSVGQHSLLCHHLAKCVDGSIALHALLHDAAEAYIGDLSSPLKSLLPRAREIEASILEAIYARLGIAAPSEEVSGVIKTIDAAAYTAEVTFFLPGVPSLPVPDLTVLFLPEAGFFLPKPDITPPQNLVDEALLYIPANLYTSGRRGRRGYASYGELSKKLERVILAELASCGARDG